MSPNQLDLLSGQPGFPRVSGDEPLKRVEKKNGAPFSPRERG